MQLIINREPNYITFFRLLIFAKNKLKRKFNISISNRIFRLSNINVAIVQSKFKNRIVIKAIANIDSVFLSKIDGKH